MMVKEALAILVTFSRLMVTNMDRPISHTSQVRLKDGFQMWLQFHAPGYSSELDPQVPCRHSNQSGLWGMIGFHAKISHLNTPLPLVLRPPSLMDRRDNAQG